VPKEVEVPRVDDGPIIIVATVFVIPASTRINFPSIGACIARDYSAGEIEGTTATDVHTTAFVDGGITCKGAVCNGEGSAVIYVYATAFGGGGIACDGAIFEGDGTIIIYVCAAAVVSGVK